MNNARKHNIGRRHQVFVDLDTLDNLKRDVSAEGLRVMLGVFRQELAERIEKVEGAVSDTDEDTLERQSHCLKSIAGQFGALPLQEAADKINELCKRKRYQQAFSAGAGLGDLGTGTLLTIDKLIEAMARI
jgi:HPt (histidine-containing phosphotransfer) domain-containing protein